MAASGCATMLCPIAPVRARSEKNPRKKSSAHVSVSSPSLETGAASGAERYCVERQTWRARPSVRRATDRLTMTYCEVGLTCSPSARSLSKAYYWWESNKSPAKSGRERRRRFFDGTNCQFRPIHRSSPPRPGRISLAPIAHTCELGEARVGHFPLCSHKDKRAYFYSFVPRAGGVPHAP